LCQSELFSLSLHRLSFFLLSLSPKKTRLSHSLLYPLIVPVSDRTRVARVCVCVCVLRPRFTSTQCACMKRTSSRENFFPTRIFAILIHAYLDTFFANNSPPIKIFSSLDRCVRPRTKREILGFSIQFVGIFVFTEHQGKKYTIGNSK